VSTQSRFHSKPRHVLTAVPLSASLFTAGTCVVGCDMVAMAIDELMGGMLCTIGAASKVEMLG
jgi:hypothetical protein